MTHRHLVVHRFLQGRTPGPNGAPASEKQVGSTGSWAEGDFNGALQAILAPTSNARFTKKRAASIAKRPAWRYDYSVEQAHSNWHLSYLSGGRM